MRRAGRYRPVFCRTVTEMSGLLGPASVLQLGSGARRRDCDVAARLTFAVGRANRGGAPPPLWKRTGNDNILTLLFTARRRSTVGSLAG